MFYYSLFDDSNMDECDGGGGKQDGKNVSVPFMH